MMMNTLLWYIENIAAQVFQMLPCMGAALILWTFFRPIRLSQLEKNGLVSLRRRELMLLAFILFCSGLCALTMFPYGFWGDCLKMIWEPGYRPQFQIPEFQDSLKRLAELPESITPFREILRVQYGGPWLWFVLWGNIGMFAPVGFCLPLLWEKRKWYHAVLAGGMYSLTIESVQVFVGRVSDIDDVILNTTGAFIGFLLYFMAYKVIPLDWKKFHCQDREDE